MTQAPRTPRANPCPKVTDPFCRLPLSTLFYQLEAVHLGDLLRLSVRLRTTHLPLDFHGPSQPLRTTRNGRLCLEVPASLVNPIPRPACQLKRKDNSFQGLCRRLQVHPRYRQASPQSRNFSRVPFLLTLSGLLRVNAKIRTDLPVSNRCSHGTFLHFSLQGSLLNICYYHQDLH